MDRRAEDLLRTAAPQVLGTLVRRHGVPICSRRWETLRGRAPRISPLRGSPAASPRSGTSTSAPRDLAKLLRLAEHQPNMMGDTVVGEWDRARVCQRLSIEFY